MRIFVFLVLAQASIFDADVFNNPEPWKELESGPMKLETRPIKGSKCYEYRVTTEVALPAERVCHAVFDFVTRQSNVKQVKVSKLLKDAGNERVMYQQTDGSVVSPRDFATTVIKRCAPKGTSYVRLKTTNDLAPPAPDNVVRMDSMWSSWTLEPMGDKTKVTVTLFSDPAGSVPTFIVHGPQRNAAKETVSDALAAALAAGSK
ncbi:MAG: START domain-containing protein [Myxococcota bacterium]